MHEISLVEVILKNRKKVGGFFMERIIQGERDSIIIAAELDPETNIANYLIEYEIDKVKSIYSFLHGDYLYKID